MRATVPAALGMAAVVQVVWFAEFTTAPVLFSPVETQVSDESPGHVTPSSTALEEE
jgi:hypothetical protein